MKPTWVLQRTEGDSGWTVVVLDGGFAQEYGLPKHMAQFATQASAIRLMRYLVGREATLSRYVRDYDAGSVAYFYR